MSGLPRDQLYAVILSADGGKDLESFEIRSMAEARSILLQVLSSKLHRTSTYQQLLISHASDVFDCLARNGKQAAMPCSAMNLCSLKATAGLLVLLHVPQMLSVHIMMQILLLSAVLVHLHGSIRCFCSASRLQTWSELGHHVDVAFLFMCHSLTCSALAQSECKVPGLARCHCLHDVTACTL